jgi:hypothetical protein
MELIEVLRSLTGCFCDVPMKPVELLIFLLDFINLPLIFSIIVITTLLKSLLELPVLILQLSLLISVITYHLFHLHHLFLQLVYILSIVRLKLLHFTL